MSTTPPDAGPPQPVYIIQPIVYARPARLKAGWSLTLGILSLFVGFAIVPPVIGFVLGLVALRSEPSGRGAAITGVVLNGLVLLALVCAAVLIVLIFVFATSGYDYEPTARQPR